MGVETELLDYQGRAGSISIVRWNLRPVILGIELLLQNPTWKSSHFPGLVSKCSATVTSVAAPPHERDRVSEVQTTRDTLQGGPGWGATGPFWGGGGWLRHPCDPFEIAERAATRA